MALLLQAVYFHLEEAQGKEEQQMKTNEMKPWLACVFFILPSLPVSLYYYNKISILTN